MPDHRTPTTFAGGFPIAIALIVGGVLGMTMGHAQWWLIGSAVVGIAIATAIWLRDKG